MIFSLIFLEEWPWNFFDLLLAASGLADVCIQLAGADMPDAWKKFEADVF